jgi:hypothetical protein
MGSRTQLITLSIISQPHRTHRIIPTETATGVTLPGGTRNYTQHHAATLRSPISIALPIPAAGLQMGTLLPASYSCAETHKQDTTSEYPKGDSNESNPRPQHNSASTIATKTARRNGRYHARNTTAIGRSWITTWCDRSPPETNADSKRRGKGWVESQPTREERLRVPFVAFDYRFDVAMNKIYCGKAGLILADGDEIRMMSR